MEDFTFHDETHTLGNVLQEYLLENQMVIFAGYNVPHPLEKVMKLKIQVLQELSAKSPHDILKNVSKKIINDLDKLEKEALRVFQNDFRVM